MNLLPLLCSGTWSQVSKKVYANSGLSTSVYFYKQQFPVYSVSLSTSNNERMKLSNPVGSSGTREFSAKSSSKYFVSSSFDVPWVKLMGRPFFSEYFSI